jgi:hypothetical protein
MQRVTSKQVLMLTLLLPIGCATRDYGAVSIVSTHPNSVKASVLAEHVEGFHCRSGILVASNEIADYGIAVRDALSRVEGANALLDAKVDFVAWNLPVYHRWCIRVSGKAAVLE